MKILALDLGKRKMAACTYDTQTCGHQFDSAPLDGGTLAIALENECPDRVVILLKARSAYGWRCAAGGSKRALNPTRPLVPFVSGEYERCGQEDNLSHELVASVDEERSQAS